MVRITPPRCRGRNRCRGSERRRRQASSVPVCGPALDLRPQLPVARFGCLRDRAARSSSTYPPSFLLARVANSVRVTNETGVSLVQLLAGVLGGVTIHCHGGILG